MNVTCKCCNHQWQEDFPKTCPRCGEEAPPSVIEAWVIALDDIQSDRELAAAKIACGFDQVPKTI